MSAVDYFTGDSIPSESDLTVDPNELAQYRTGGTLNPQFAQASSADNAMAGVQGNTAARQAQLGALGQIQDIARNGGLNATDQAALASARNTTNAQNKANQSAILQHFSQEGRGGSGAQLAAQLESQQGTANQMADLGQQTAGNAQQRALSAMAQSGQMGNAIENQAFGENATKAAAANAINQFNAQNKQQASEFNANAGNQAQQFNIANQQAANFANAGARNQSLFFNANAPQTIFSDQLAKSQAMSGADLGQQQIDNMILQAIIGGIGTTLGGAAQGLGKMAAKGGKIDDNYANDNIPAMLSAGEAVIPKSVLAKGDKAILDFIHAGKTDKELFDAGKAFEQLTKGKPSRITPEQVKAHKEAFAKLSGLFKGE